MLLILHTILAALLGVAAPPTEPAPTRTNAAVEARWAAAWDSAD